MTEVTLQALRRELHQIPEIGLDLPKTLDRLLRELEPLAIELTTSPRIGSVVGVIRGKSTGRAVLLRADMDALPVREPEGLDFRSLHEGAMHACGHDMHMAGLVGAARLLAARRDQLAGDVVLMFQPGEERCGGARIMIDEGVLEAAGPRVGAAFAVHVGPGPRGLVTTRSGPILAGSNELRVTIRGRGGHGSTPHTARNPVSIAAAVATAIESFTAERFDPFDPVVATVTMLHGGELVNVIPDEARLAATVRTFSESSIEIIHQQLVPLIEGTATARGATAHVEFIVDYPVTVNAPDLTDWVGDVVAHRFGNTRLHRAEHPLMGSEDFSFVAARVPSTMMFLGATPDGLDPRTAASVHSPNVVFDDAVLDDQAALLATLAEQWLAQASGVAP